MHWYFGYGAGLDFSSGSPVVDTTGKSESPEATFVMSDTCGNLLFYGTESLDYPGYLVVWNKEHQVMENGLLWACCNPTQIVCVPQPENDSIFYIFYPLDGGSMQGKFLYAIVNVNQNNFLGEVISKDNILFDSLSTEKCGVTKHCNGTDYWIASKQNGKSGFTQGNSLYAWLLTEYGLATLPVVSSPGNIMEENGDGYFRFSPDGAMAAAAYVYPASLYYGDSSYVEIYKFDNCTGIFSDPITIQFPQAYGLCFSPDNTKLYVGCCDAVLFGGIDTAYIKQYDLSIYEQSHILSSETILKQGAIGNHFQIGIDGKIYVGGYDTTLTDYGGNLLGVIKYPNLQGSACGYFPHSIDLGISASSTWVFEGLPYWPDSYFSSFDYAFCPSSGSEETAIVNEIKIFPNPCGNILNINSELLPNAEIEILDVMGRNILQQRSDNTTTNINTEVFPIGIYIIRITFSDNQFTNLKFLKQ
jgi:hypothetical protein